MTDAIDYEQVLADLEGRRAQLDQAIVAIKQLIVGIASAVPSVKIPDSLEIAEDAFHGMSIADAAKKYLGMVRRKQSTKELMKAVVKGGLPASAYNTVYAILRRREDQVGDITKVGNDWGLSEWYPGRGRRQKKNAPMTPPENGTEDETSEE